MAAESSDVAVLQVAAAKAKRCDVVASGVAVSATLRRFR